MAGLGPKLSLRTELQGLGFAPKTVSTYVRVVGHADDWCRARGTTLAKVSGPLIAQYADTLSRSWSTRKELRSGLRHYWAITKRRNPPLAFIRVPPKPTMVCRAVDDHEAMMLAKTARAHADKKGMALALGLYQAMRREEMTRARWVDFEDGHVTIIGKFDKQRRIPLHPEILDKVATLERTSEYLFPGRFGDHVSLATVWAWIRKLAEEAGVPGVTPHQLRHTCLATQNDNNKDLRATMWFAGHSRPETTSGYTRSRETAVHAAMMSVDYLHERPRGRPRTPKPEWPSLFEGDDEPLDW